MRLCIFALGLLLLSDDFASAGAWVRAQGKNIIAVETSYNSGADFVSDRNVPNFIFTGASRQRYYQIYGEFGIAQGMAIIFKLAEVIWQSGHRQQQYFAPEIATQFSTPEIAISLLPFGIYTFLKNRFPNIDFARDKTASISLGVYYNRASHNEEAFMNISFADKIIINDHAIVFALDYRYGRAHREIFNTLGWEWRQQLTIRVRYFDKYFKLQNYRSNGLEYSLDIKARDNVWLSLTQGRVRETSGIGTKNTFRFGVHFSL